MKKELSIYLDLLRFTAAMTVFLGHAAGKLTGGFLWQLGNYLSASVMVFFVLSGFFIAFVYDTKEKTLKGYSIARASRLSSVVYPALILTIICGYIGMKMDPSLYLNGPWPVPDNNAINYFLSSLLIQNIWGLDLNPGINVPFWSLSFELMFYILFAVCVYLKRYIRFVLFMLVCLIAGPDILIYFPIWLLGVVVYFLLKEKSIFIERFSFISSLIAITSLILLIIFVPWIKGNLIYSPDFMISPRNIFADYVVAIIYSIHLMFVLPLLNLIKPILFLFAKPIVYLSSLTFTLYLFHRPLIQVFATVFNEPSSFENRFTVIGGTLLVVLIIGRWCEMQKYPIKQFLTKLSSK